MELVIDGVGTNRELMRSGELLKRWFKQCADCIGMHLLGEPVMVEYPWPASDMPAWSGVGFLQESSITVHVYPETDAVFCNIFSCKDFDFKKAIGFVNYTFLLTHFSYIVLDRGVELETKRITLVSIMGLEKANE